MLKRLFQGLLLAGAFALPAAAQVQVSGPITAGHALKFVAPNVASDAGGAAGGVPGVGLTELGITKSVAVGSTGPAPFCLYDQAATLPSHQLCFDPGNGSNAVISVTSLGGAASEGLNLVINGTAYPVIGGGGNVVGPVSTAIPDLVTFNSNVGTAISSASLATFPSSISNATARAQVNVGNYPANGRLPGNVIENIVSMLVVPSSYAQGPWPNTNYSAYCQNNNVATGNSCVGYFSWATVGSGGSSNWNFNSIFSNQNGFPVSPGSGSGDIGVDFGLAVGAEFDFNVLYKPGAVIPAGTVVGVMLNGAAAVSPSGDSYMILGYPFGGPNSNIPWSFGFQTAVGATVVALDIGALATGNNQSSQPIYLHSTSSGGVAENATLQANPAGVLILSATAVETTTFIANTGYNFSSTPFATTAADITAIYDGQSNQSLLLGGPGAGGGQVNHYRSAAHSFEPAGGVGVQFMALVPIGGAGTTAMQLEVNNNAGANLANVSIGAANSCGSARCVIVPN